MKRKISAWMCLGGLIFGILGAEIPAYADDVDSILEESSYAEPAELEPEPTPEPEIQPEAEVPEAEPVEEVTGGIDPQALTPEGNLTLVDDIGGEAAGEKQFLTVVTKSGRYFYIIIDHAKDGENTVHFLNQVDEADLLALMDQETKDTLSEVCTCTEQCSVGEVNPSCAVCTMDLSRCLGQPQEVETVTNTEAAAENTKTDVPQGLWMLAVLGVVLLAGIGVGYFLVIKPKKNAKTLPSLDDYELEDEMEDKE